MEVDAARPYRALCYGERAVRRTCPACGDCHAALINGRTWALAVPSVRAVLHPAILVRDLGAAPASRLGGTGVPPGATGDPSPRDHCHVLTR